jgi:hypothetical protein
MKKLCILIILIILLITHQVNEELKISKRYYNILKKRISHTLISTVDGKLHSIGSK